MTTPMPAQMAEKARRSVTCAQASTSAVAATEPAVMRARAPCRSSQRPTGIAATPDRMMASE
jgi:hypothetical protein